MNLKAGTMYLYVELWNVTQEWMDLSREERSNFLTRLKTDMKQLTDAGIENLGWAMNDEHTPHRSDYRYMTVWKLPSLEAVEKLEKEVADSGWYKYFSHQNSRGKIMSNSEMMDFLLNLDKQSTSLTE